MQNKMNVKRWLLACLCLIAGQVVAAQTLYSQWKHTGFLIGTFIWGSCEVDGQPSDVPVGGSSHR